MTDVIPVARVQRYAGPGWIDMLAQPVRFHKTAPHASPTLPGSPAHHAPRKPFVRRRGDLSQQIRLASQVVFGSIAALAGIQFVMWVRYFESGGTTTRVARPGGVEAWLPIAALMNLKAFVLTGEVPQVHPAGMFMLVAFMAGAPDDVGAAAPHGANSTSTLPASCWKDTMPNPQLPGNVVSA